MRGVLSEYRRIAMYIEANQEETIKALQAGMDAQRVSQAELAEITRTNKAKISRDFNGKTKLRPEMAFLYARALGGTLRLRFVEQGMEEIFFDRTTDSLDKLFEEMHLETNIVDMSAIVYNEIPIALCQELGIDAKDFFIFLEGPGQVEVRPERTTVADRGYVIVFTNREKSDFDFGMLISPDGSSAAFGVWQRAGNLSLLPQYKDFIGYDKHEEDPLNEFKARNSNWIPQWYLEHAVCILPVKVYFDGLYLYPELERMFEGYAILFEKQTGLTIRRVEVPKRECIEARDILKEVDEILGKGKEAVLGETENKCEIDPNHELFDDEDGKPYVEVVRLIPITKETTELYGEKLKSTANSVVLCPMCAAKLEHGSWRIKEDMLMQLYDKKVEGLKKAGLDISRFDLLSARQKKSETSEVGKKRGLTSFGRRFVSR